jgi:N-methylhydantoinase B
MTPGGGGWGNPLDRDPLAVQRDVWDGFVSPESALADYGVVLDPQTMEIDKTATQERRQQMRGETAMFHRGRYLTELEQSAHP